MTAVCLLDTSVFVEILNVLRKASQHDAILMQLRARIEAKESLFLPMATILETGNHIGQKMVTVAKGGLARSASLHKLKKRLMVDLSNPSVF